MSAQALENPRLKNFVDSVSKMRGVSYVAASSEGLPYFAKGIEASSADYISALANSLHDRISEISKSIGFGDVEWVKLYPTETSRIYIFKFQQFIMILKYDFALDRIIEMLVNNLKKGVSVICYNCKTDLTFRIYKCPKCGASNTYNASRCWSCGADIRLKHCPNCGKLILPDGSKPGFFTVLIYKLKSVFSK